MKSVNLLKLKWLMYMGDYLTEKDKSFIDSMGKLLYNTSDIPQNLWDKIDRIYDVVKMEYKFSAQGGSYDYNEMYEVWA